MSENLWLKKYMIKANGLFTNIEVKAKEIFSFLLSFPCFIQIFFLEGGLFFGERKWRKGLRYWVKEIAGGI